MAGIITKWQGDAQAYTHTKWFSYACGTYTSSWLQLLHHSLLIDIAQLYFPHHLENQIINSPTLNIWLSNVFHHTKLFAIFSIQPHGKNGNCIILIMFPCCTAKQETHTKNNTHNHGDNQITEPSSKALTKHSDFNDSDVAPLLYNVKARRPDPLIAQQPLP